MAGLLVDDAGQTDAGSTASLRGKSLPPPSKSPFCRRDSSATWSRQPFRATT